MEILPNFIQSVTFDEIAILEDYLKFVVFLCLVPGQTVLVGVVFAILDNTAAASLGFLEVAGISLGIFEDHNGFSIRILGICCLYGNAKGIASIWSVGRDSFLNGSITDGLQTLHRERSNAQCHIIDSKAVALQNFIDLPTPLRRDTVAVQGFDVRV